MTTGIILRTSESETEVLEAISKLGFDEPTRIGDPYTHNTVDKLVLQLHSGNGNGFIEIEYEDHSNRFPNHPEAVEILEALYKNLPDTMYTQHTFPLQPYKPLSEYLPSLNKES